jgi:hypothetical protein
LKEDMMKLSLIVAAALSVFAVACSDLEGSGGPAPRNTDVSEPPETPPPAPEPRRLLDQAEALPTSPANLIIDPGFGLLGGQAGFSSFIAFLDGGFTQLDLKATVDSRSPAGFGGNVALVKSDSATNKKSEAIVALTSFLGGAGPFRAQVWISKSTVSGTPTEVPTEASAVRVSIAEEDPEGDAFDLTAVPEASRFVSGRTWVLFRAAVEKTLPYGGFFVVRTGEGGGMFHVAAPEITPQALEVGMSVKSSRLARAAVARRKTSSERAAITKVKAIPPRLVPASAAPHFGARP